MKDNCLLCLFRLVTSSLLVGQHMLGMVCTALRWQHLECQQLYVAHCCHGLVEPAVRSSKAIAHQPRREMP